MADALTIKVAKAPAWMFGSDIDLQPKIDNALDSAQKNLADRQGKGMGAKRNEIMQSRELGARRIDSTLIFPRTTGSAWSRNAEGRFRGLAQRTVTKYIVVPLEAEWAASRSA